MENFSDQEAAEALTKVLSDSKWEAVALAHGYLALLKGQNDELAARTIYQRGPQTLKKSRELIKKLKAQSFLSLLTPRDKRGSAENPITKLFPATITEERFIELLDDLQASRPSVHYSDEREVRHSLTDLTLQENELELPINVKTAGTRFRQAQQLVGLSPDDCLPIPAYKAHGALARVPNLIYVVSVDYDLVDNLNNLLPSLFQRNEAIVWSLLNNYKGALIRSAEDSFIFSTVRKYWPEFKKIVKDTPFHVISARKAIRILNTQPQRTPGIGLRAWGTGARAEVNVHLSIQEDTTPWQEVRERIKNKGVADIIEAINRKKMELVDVPEI